MEPGAVGRMTRPFVRHLTTAFVVLAIWLALVAPAAAIVGWSQTGGPRAARAGEPTEFTLRVSNVDLLSDLGVDSIGCIRVTVGPNFAIQSVEVDGAPEGRTWLSSHGGGVATVQSEDGGGRLREGQSVTFVITAVPQAVGTSDWTTRVIRDQDCGGSPIAGTETFTINVVSGPAPTPTPPPAPTPKPTPVPIPTPVPPRPSVPTPSSSLPPPSMGTASPSPSPAGGPGPRSASPAPDPADDGDPGAPGAGRGPGRGSAAVPGRGLLGLSGDVGVFPPDFGKPARGEGFLVAPFNAIEGGFAELGVGLAGIDLFGDPVWAIPAASIAGPGLLVLLWLALQTAGASVWIPFVRRLRGERRDR